MVELVGQAALVRTALLQVGLAVLVPQMVLRAMAEPAVLARAAHSISPVDREHRAFCIPARTPGAVTVAALRDFPRLSERLLTDKPL